MISVPMLWSVFEVEREAGSRFEIGSTVAVPSGRLGADHASERGLRKVEPDNLGRHVAAADECSATPDGARADAYRSWGRDLGADQ
jgi:hypothetical protein